MKVSGIQFVALATLGFALTHAYEISSQATGPLPMQFDGSGNVNWSISPEGFFFWQLCFLGFMNAMTLGLSFIMPKASIRWINVPFKSFWMENEKRQQACKIHLVNNLCLAAILINGISLLAQEMISQKAGMKPLLFALSLEQFMTLTLTMTVVFLAYTFYIFRPRA